MAGRAAHSPGISRTPGMAATRRTEREHEWLAHEGSYPTYGPSRVRTRIDKSCEGFIINSMLGPSRT